MSLKLVKVETKPHALAVVTYKVEAFEPGRNGIHLEQEAEFTFWVDGKVTAAMTFEGMPYQPDFQAAKRRLELYCRLMAKGLRQSGKPRATLPLF